MSSMIGEDEKRFFGTRHHRSLRLSQERVLTWLIGATASLGPQLTNQWLTFDRLPAKNPM